MLLSGQNRLLAAGALLAVVAIPATFLATDASLAATFSAESLPNLLTLDSGIIDAEPAAAQTVADATEIDAELECMAKVVLHEAANQPRAGQLAVAQLIQARMESGRFADTVCGVVNQPGQFFRTATYNPRRDTAAWENAVSVSREARDGASADVAPGAMFFRAAYAPPSGFFRNRTRVATLGDHVFYR
jgi:N-acetylmuramoyl-L-alanine amidase